MNTVVGHAGNAINAQSNTFQPFPTITNNNFDGNATYKLQYNAPASARDLLVSGNWWGATDLTIVANMILDSGENANLGSVVFNPVALGPISGAPTGGFCASCTKTVPADHWKGEYWNNPALSGPVKMVRDDGDGALNFDFGTGSPDLNCGVSNNWISARWTRTINITQSGIYEFAMVYDDTYRLYIDDQQTPVFSDDCYLNNRPCPQAYTQSVFLTAGPHIIKTEFEELDGAAVAKLSYALLVPTSTPTNTFTITTTPPTITRTPVITSTPTITPPATITASRTITRTPGVTPTGPSPTVTPSPTSTRSNVLQVGSVTLSSGQQRLAIPILLTNDIDVRAVQFSLSDTPDEVTLTTSTSCSTTARSSNLTCTCNETGGVIDCVLLSTGDGVIASGTGAIATVFVDDVVPSCRQNTSVQLSLSFTELADTNRSPVPHGIVDGVSPAAAQRISTAMTS